MRVLVVHNLYRSDSPSGENQAVTEEIEALEAAGVEVVPYLRSSDEIDSFRWGSRAVLGLRPLRSPEDAARVSALIRRHRPDVIHLHNPYPLISPWVIRIASAAGVPVVQTVHNYRHTCIAGSLYRDGRMCHDCVPTRSRWPGVRHACYRGSIPQSISITAAELVHRGSWLSVARFLVPTQFGAMQLIARGIPSARVVVRPNAVPDPGPIPSRRGHGFAFVGRLDEQKGILILVDAWRRMPLGSHLVIAGDGPCRREVAQLALERDDVTFLGLQTRQGVQAVLDAAAVVIVPSVVHEGFGRVVIEAFARGRPVVATAIEPLASLVTPDVGWTSTPDPRALASILSDLDGIEERGLAARKRFLQEFTTEIALRRLLRVYGEVAA